jgi:hypothetical protein
MVMTAPYPVLQMDGSALHPAERRRQAVAAPYAKAHVAILRPIGSRSFDVVPINPYTNIIHTSRKAKWVEALFADLAAPDWEARLGSLRTERRSNGATGLLELHLPIHRRHQIILFEAVCRAPGAPRLDPKSITGAGMLLRRNAANASQHPSYEAWIKSQGTVLGWQSADESAQYDPDPKQRRNRHKANAAIRAHLAQRQSTPQQKSEEIISLHVVPEHICAARGKTLLYGLIPVSSIDAADEAPPALNYAQLPPNERAEMIGHLSIFLKERPARALPRAGQALDPKWNILAPETANEDLRSFGLFVHQISSELNLFSGKTAVQPLAQALRAMQLPQFTHPISGAARSIDAYSFLQKACDILLLNDTTQSAEMPIEWPQISAAQADILCSAALDCLTDSYATAVRAPPKFSRKQAQYAVKPFIRTSGHGDCPDGLQWGGYSEPFRILEHWEGDGPGIRISLPDMDQLRKLKPNVSFDVPPFIAAVLGGDMKKLAKGEPGGTGAEIAWLCSFSIPIITLCAFIVLHIFLSLLDIIFRWMLWIKICVPIPKSKQGE